MTAPDEWRLDVLDLDAYLARIGYDGPRSATPEVLRAVHLAHIAEIRFENLDLILGRGVSTELADVQAKFVGARRGGYCYEHGTLLGAVLQRLGFKVVRMLARVGPDGAAIRPRSHLALDVTAADGSRWLADTGFGSGLLEPLPFVAEAPHRQGGWTFRLHVVPAEDDRWRLQLLERGEWVTQYRFEEVPQHAVDIEAANWFTSTNPHSPFLRQPVIARKDGGQVWALRGRELTIERPDGSKIERTLDDAEVAAALAEQLGDALDDGEIRALIATLPARPRIPARRPNRP